MAYFGHFSASQRLIITHQTSHWSYVIPVGSDTPVGTFPRTHIGGGEPILGLSEAIRDGGSTIGDGGSTASEASGRVPEADIHSPNQTIRHVFSRWCLTQPLGTFPRHTIRPGTLSDGALMPWDRTRWEGPRTLPAGPKGLAARSSGPPFSPRRFPGLEGGRAEKRAKNPFSWKGEEDYRVAAPQC